MKENKEIKLVNGIFSPEEAKEVLYKLINSKIKYHQLEKFSSTERNMGDVNFSEDRINQLEVSKSVIDSQIEFAQKANKSIKIDGTIVLEFTDKL